MSRREPRGEVLCFAYPPADSIYEEFRDRERLVEADHDASDRHLLDLARGLSHVQGLRV